MSTFYQNVGRNNSRSMREFARMNRQPAAAAATLPAAPSGEKAYHQACDRLSQLLPRAEYLHFITEEVYGSWAEMIGVVEAEIIRLEIEADPLREFRTVETGAEFDPAMDTDLYA